MKRSRVVSIRSGSYIIRMEDPGVGSTYKVKVPMLAHVIRKERGMPRYLVSIHHTRYLVDVDDIRWKL